MLSDLYRYRGYIYRNAVRDLRHRYSGTSLGFFWNVIIPLVTITMYSIVFARLMPQVLPGQKAGPYLFVLYLCSGMLPWMAFNECVLRGTTAFVDNATYLKKMSMPEQIFVAQAALSSTFSLGINLVLLLIAALLFGSRPTWLWLMLPVFAILWQALGFAIGLLLGTLNVFLRDISQMVGVLFQLWMWSVPVVYLTRILPKPYIHWLWLNPPFAFLRAIHDVMVYARMPPWYVWPVMLGWVTLFLLLGALALHRLRAEIRDVV